MVASLNGVIVFDLGGVLIDWDPRHLYRKLFDEDAAMERFLSEIATSGWNSRQDAGRSWDKGVAELTARHPEAADLIAAYHTRWDEMLAGPITGTVAILEELHASGAELHALTNWSTETFPIARRRYHFLDLFRQIVVSGEERLIKPDTRLFEVLLDRIGRKAAECIFIDDSPANIATAITLGFDAIQFESPDRLRSELELRGFLRA